MAAYPLPYQMQPLYFVPVYTRPRGSTEDIPPGLTMTSPHYQYSYTMPSYISYQPYQPQSYHSSISDDLTIRMRPDTESILNRSYNKYGPLNWSWTDFTQSQRSRISL